MNFKELCITDSNLSDKKKNIKNSQSNQCPTFVLNKNKRMDLSPLGLKESL